MGNDNEIIDNIANKEYEFGFVTDIEMDVIPAGLDDDTVRFISEKKGEPGWLLNWRLKVNGLFTTNSSILLLIIKIQ